MKTCLIKKALIYDGSGQLPFTGDLLMVQGRIASIQRHIPGIDCPTIAANGMALAPGFINLHSHSDLEIFKNSRMLHAIRQGITTEIVGQDGFSAAPVKDSSLGVLSSSITHLAGSLPEEFWWRGFGEYQEAIEKAQPAVRVEGLVGNGTLRLVVMGSHSQVPTPGELQEMKDLLAQSMEEGARGLSLGLVYPPSSYAQREEIIQLAQVVSHYDGVLMVHMRDEGGSILDALEEVGEIGQGSGVRINISHLKILGPKNWGQMEKVLQALYQLQQKGLDITFDQYPYTAGCTGLKRVVPQWAFDGGQEAFLERLENPRLYESICREVEEHIEEIRGGAENILISNTTRASFSHLEGKNLLQAAEELEVSPAQAALELVKEDRGVVAVYFSMHESDLEKAMGSPLQGICTDGIVGSKPHPRTYDAFARVLGYYIRERKLMELREGIRRMTMEPARRLRLWDRGLIREGLAADLVLFHPGRIQGNSTYENPALFPSGILSVWVKGVNQFFQEGCEEMKKGLPG